MGRTDRSHLKLSLQARASETFSPFVLRMHDSESGNADPSGTSLALSYRLAGDQPDRSLPTRRGAVRTLQAPAWSSRCPARGERWHMVGRRCANMARWTRPSASACPCLHRPRCNSNDAQTRLSCNGPSEPRPKLQRAALAQSGRALPTLPHDPRCGRASQASLVECLSSACARRSLHRPLSLTGQCAPRPFGIRLFATAGAAVRLLFSEARSLLLLRFKLTGATGHGRVSSYYGDKADG